MIDDDKPVGRHDGVANLGIRPMFEIEAPLLETWLFDFDGDLYGKHLAVEFVVLSAAGGEARWARGAEGTN